MADFSSFGPSNPFNSSRSGSSNPFAGPSVAVIRDVPVLERVPIKLSHTAANFFAWKTYFGLLFREYDLLDHIDCTIDLLAMPHDRWPLRRRIRDVPVLERVLIKLSHTTANFFAWKTYFGLLFREYDLLDHIDGTIDLLAMPHDLDWGTIDATIIRWFFQTVSTDIFHTVVRDGDTARDVWKKITDLFTDNKIQRITFFYQEFFGLHQNDLSLNAFCLRLKTLSDELRDLEFPITDALLLSTLAAGLDEDLSHAASNLTLLTTPTYEQAVAYLRNEERRLKHLRAHAAHTAFAAGLSHGAPAPSSTGLPPRAPAPYYPPQQPATALWAPIISLHIQHIAKFQYFLRPLICVLNMKYLYTFGRRE
jgi:hypothetical protein